MIDFIDFNANPKNNSTNDCVIRAITLYKSYMFHDLLLSQFGMPYGNRIVDDCYKDTYFELSQLGIEDSLMLNDERLYMKLLKNKYQLQEDKYDGKNITMNDLIEHYGYREDYKNCIVNLNGHLTCILDWTLVDTFDCRNQYVESVLYLPKNYK